MPLQNRVNPFGDLVASPARGTLIGNRGVVHTANREITRRWTTRRWICCLLAFKGRHREVMTPNRWTELFFLDEATALAAGHRPCYECRRADATAFRDAWHIGNPESPVERSDRIERVDHVLHNERTLAQPERPVRRLRSLAPGVMFTAPAGGPAHLWWANASWVWSFEGYARVESPGGEVRLITPASIERALHAGYAPRVHESAFRS